MPRSTYVANASKLANDAYSGRGPRGPSDAGRRDDLDLHWEGVWTHDALFDVTTAVRILEDSGVFVRETAMVRL